VEKMEHLQIYLVGDSTVSNYDSSVAPRTGWGQVLGNYLTTEVLVKNYASSGRSSKSFIDEGKLDEIEMNIRKNDYLFIQFGHNDGKPDKERYTNPHTSFKNYINKYVELAKSKQAFPVLITPVQRRSFDESGAFKETHGDYPTVIRQLAAQCEIPLIDLTAKSRRLYERLGAEESKKLFLWFQRGENINYPDGVQDDTHFSLFGANEIAHLVIKEFEKLNLPLVKYVDQNQ
jgi:lysophospholipase L1-like esterase